MRLKNNIIKIYIHDSSGVIKVIEDLYINVSITNIAFNQIPQAVIEIKGLDREFSRDIVRKTNVIGIRKVVFYVTIFAGKEGEKLEKVFVGAVVAADIDSPPDNTLVLVAKVGAQHMGVYSVFYAPPQAGIKEVVDQFKKHTVVLPKRTNSLAPPNLSRISQTKSVILNNKPNLLLPSKELASHPMDLPLEVFISKNVPPIKIGGMVFSGSLENLLNEIENHDIRIRYVWGTKDNSLGFHIYGKSDNTYKIQSKQILQQIDVLNNGFNVKITGFFDDFSHIKVSDGIIISSEVKSYLSYTYHVTGIEVDISTKDVKRWNITLHGRYVNE